MGAITHLPSAVHSFLRSGAILFDLTRVVEELIFNSLDAGAMKVYVSIGVKACYVKVDDDGCGITRDGLVLLGERYATSKIHCSDDINAGTGTLGFRGEALSSLSDVSLLEVISKARGRPNGYRKVIKGCKCLFLGIDGQRQDFGTTVIVRDLFYNQPVRRKYLQSSPKKVLHSLKKCILRTALVWPHVSFKITDIESEDELLFTLPSLSPLPLVADGFGNEVSSCLHEVNFSKGGLKLFGYLSGPADSFCTKVFQYVYINSQFVCKSPIHKLMNKLAASLQSYFATGKYESEPQNGKRHVNRERHQLKAYPAYMLNLCCTHCSYDLTFEPSKTMVEFKDWVSVLSFIEEAVRYSWTHFLTRLTQGKSRVHEDAVPGEGKIWKSDDGILCPLQGISGSFEIPRKKCKIQHHQNSACLSPPTGYLGSLTKEVYALYKTESRERHKDLSQAKRDCSFLNTTTARNVTYDKYNQVLGMKNNSDFWEPDHDLFPLEAHNFLSEGSMARQDEYSEKEDILGLKWENESVDVEPILSKGRIKRMEKVEHLDFKIGEGKFSYLSDFHRAIDEPVSKICPSQGSVPPDSISFSYHEGFDGKTNISDLDFNEGQDFRIKSPWRDKFTGCQTSSSVIRKCQMFTDLGELSSDLIEHRPCDEEGFTLECEYPNLLPVAECDDKEALYESIDPKRYILSPYMGTCSQGFSSFKRKCSSYYREAEGKDEYLSCGAVKDSSNEDKGTPNSINTELSYKHWFSPERKTCHFDKVSEEVDWLYLDSHAANNKYNVLALDFPSPNYGKVVESLRDKLTYENSRDSRDYSVSNGRGSRSHSAPPLYRGKRKFFILNDYLATKAMRELNGKSFHSPLTSPVSQSQCLDPLQTHDILQCHAETISVDDSLEKSPFSIQLFHNKSIVQGTALTKCRIGDPLQSLVPISNVQMEMVSSHHPIDQENCILDISSGLLHLSGGSLVPESINKDCLDGAKVLLQLDRKFIPVIAGRTLTIIDQHAADERIRLEELRRKVLSGEGKTVTYLDPEKELVIRESGFQLLQNYAEQIKNWGWLCNIHVPGSGSFTKNLNLLHKQAFCVILVAVPSILGINLTDKDLLEFIEQLAETDGSSTIPPAVIRVLNFKACRGAIMFGDSLLPSECSLIVEELRGTSLCFQCAHGRPTTVPIVNLDALHKQVAMLESQNGRSDGQWHGLRQHRPSLERAELRLRSARGHHG